MWTSWKTDFRSSKSNFRGHDISRPTPRASLSALLFSLGLKNKVLMADLLSHPSSSLVLKHDIIYIRHEQEQEKEKPCDCI